MPGFLPQMPRFPLDLPSKDLYIDGNHNGFNREWLGMLKCWFCERGNTDWQYTDTTEDDYDVEMVFCPRNSSYATSTEGQMTSAIHRKQPSGCRLLSVSKFTKTFHFTEIWEIRMLVLRRLWLVYSSPAGVGSSVLQHSEKIFPF